MKRSNIDQFKYLGEEPRGFSDKKWMQNGTQRMLIKYNNEIYADQDLMETISSSIFKEIGISCVDVKLGFDSKKGNCCIVDSFLKQSGDVSYNMDMRWIDSKTGDLNRDISSSVSKVFSCFYKLYDISDQDIEQMKKDFIRMLFGDCIIGNEDRQLRNINVIFNDITLLYRLAPAFDNGLAFHSYQIGVQKPICYIGNQNFFAMDVLKYIVTYHKDYIIDIVGIYLEKFENEIPKILRDYETEIPLNKLNYIYSHLKSIKEELEKEFISTHEKK